MNFVPANDNVPKLYQMDEEGEFDYDYYDFGKLEECDEDDRTSQVDEDDEYEEAA